MFKLKTRSLLRLVVLVPAGLILVSGCGNEEDAATLEIEGTYNDGYYDHEITAATWSTDGPAVFHIVDFDNDAGLLIAQNDVDNEYSPELWSRFDWTWDGDDLYYCQSVFDGADEDTARSGSGPDATDLETGCGGFPWSLLTPI